MTTDPITQAREVLAEWDAKPRHGSDPDHCGVCYGACGGWPGEIAGDPEPHANLLGDALRALIEHAEKLAAERDAAIKNRDEWASRMMEFATAQQDLAAAQAVIAQALDFPACDVKYDGGTLGSRMRRILSSVPLDALQAERARVWDEGRKAWAKYELACEDASAAGQGHLVRTPVNPYITHTEGATS